MIAINNVPPPPLRSIPGECGPRRGPVIVFTGTYPTHEKWGIRVLLETLGIFLTAYLRDGKNTDVQILRCLPEAIPILEVLSLSLFKTSTCVSSQSFRQHTLLKRGSEGLER